MDLDYPPDAEAYRAKVCRFLDDHLPANWAGIGALPPDEQESFRRSWRGTLQDNRMLAINWPVEYGGAGLSSLEQLIVAEEFTRRGVPQGGLNDNASIQMLGGTLLLYGTEEQKNHYLPRILSGDDIWCQGFSEPEAGSDLAGLRTQARLRNGTWLISGQKTWTSYGHLATHIFVLCRTDPDSTRHRGLSLLMCPLDQPAIVVRPLHTMTGEADFNEVFFDEAECDESDVVGPVGAGWEVARTLLGFERGEATATLATMFRDDFAQDFLALAHRFNRIDDPLIRQRLARAYEGVEQMRCTGLDAVTQWLAGKPIGAESSMHKLYWSEWLQSTTALAMDIMGAAAAAPVGPGLSGVTFPAAEAGALRETGTWVDYFLRARAATIYAGSSEIQRNIVAERLLGLPQEQIVSLHFGLTAEQVQLRSAVRAFMDVHSPLHAVQQGVDTGADHDKRVWELLCAELDLVGLAVPESLGGSGASVFELCIAFGELGRSLYTGPFFSAAAIAAPSLLALGDAAACAELLPRLIRGQITIGVAGLDRWPGSAPAAQATSSLSGWTITGTVPRVLDAALADHIVVFADAPSGPQGFLVEGTAVERNTEPCLDLTRRLSTCTFSGAAARPLGGAERGQDVLDEVLDTAAVCLAAEAIGAAEAINALTLAHAKRRTQFGQPIGSFQAVKHLCVNAAMAVQSAKHLVLYAAWAVATGAADASISASAAVAASTEASVLASNTGIQVHGGIGYTWEHPAHLFLKRAMTSRVLFGTPEQHRERHLSLLLAQS